MAVSIVFAVGLATFGLVGEWTGTLVAGGAPTLVGAAIVVLAMDLAVARVVPAAADRDVLFSTRLPLRSLIDKDSQGEILPADVKEAVLYVNALPAERITGAEQWVLEIATHSGLKATFDGLSRSTLEEVQSLVTEGKDEHGRQIIAPAVWAMGKQLYPALAWIEDHKIPLRTVRVGSQRLRPLGSQ